MKDDKPFTMKVDLIRMEEENDGPEYLILEVTFSENISL